METGIIMSAKDKLAPWTPDEIMAHVALTGRVYAIPNLIPLETLLELAAEGKLVEVDMGHEWRRFEPAQKLHELGEAKHGQ